MIEFISRHRMQILKSSKTLTIYVLWYTKWKVIVLFYRKKAHMIIYIKDLVYLLEKFIMRMLMIWGRKIHYVYVKNIAHVFKTWAIRFYSEKDHRYCPMCNKSIPKKNIEITSEAAIISTKYQQFQNSQNLASLWSFTTSTTSCKGRLLSMPTLIAFSKKKSRVARHTKEARAQFGGLLFCKYMESCKDRLGHMSGNIAFETV